MSEIKLKPCPFCGGEAEFVRKPVKANGGWCDAVYVRCTACDARSNRVLYSANIHRNDSEYTEATEAWNTRKPMERIVEQINNRILKAGRIMVENPKDELDKIANDTAKDFIDAYNECIEIIQKGGAE